MSELTPTTNGAAETAPGTTPEPTPGTTPDAGSRPGAGLVSDLRATLLVCLALAVVAALVWWQFTPLAEFTRTKDSGAMGEEDLAKQVNADGWFFVVTAAGGLISGVVLAWWRRTDPVRTVVLVALGGLLAAWVTTVLGKLLGPPDPGGPLAKAVEGAKVPVQLTYEAKGLLVIWPIAALAAAIVVLWGFERE